MSLPADVPVIGRLTEDAQATLYEGRSPVASAELTAHTAELLSLQQADSSTLTH